MSRFAKTGRSVIAGVVGGCVFLLLLRFAFVLSDTSYWNARLLRAVEACDDRMAVDALNHGANPNLKFVYTNRVNSIQGAYWWLTRDKHIYWHEEPLLTEVCQNHDLLLMQELTRHGADIQARDRSGCTALFESVEIDYAMKSSRLTEFLLAEGAVVSVKDNGGQTALDEAIADNEGLDSPLVKLLRRRLNDEATASGGKH